MDIATLKARHCMDTGRWATAESYAVAHLFNNEKYLYDIYKRLLALVFAEKYPQALF